MATIPEQAKALLKGKNFAHLATLMPDGSPQVTPVWVDHDGDTVLVNTAKGRIKHRNLERDGRVALSVMDHENPYVYLAVRGKVRSMSEGPEADAHIDSLAQRYVGTEKYEFGAPGEVRVLIEIEPEKVSFDVRDDS